jgi:hypothetical protein
VHTRWTKVAGRGGRSGRIGRSDRPGRWSRCGCMAGGVQRGRSIPRATRVAIGVGVRGRSIRLWVVDMIKSRSMLE